MIYIFSQSDDMSTTKVLKWLNHFNVEYRRINVEDDIENEFNIEIKNNRVSSSYYSINQDDVVWFRRGRVKYFKDHTLQTDLPNEIYYSVKSHLLKEAKVMNEFIYGNLGFRYFGNPLNYEVNKLTTLKLASEIGFNIPHTFISNRKDSLFKSDLNFPVVVKPISDNISLRYQNGSTTNKILLLDQLECCDLPDEFGETMFQEYIQKAFEVRVFVFLDKMYALANFSKLNKLSHIDGRNIVNEKGMVNRLVPFELDDQLKIKIQQLVKALDLATGSIDLLFDTSYKCYFLEINPVGQYEYLSYVCNYNIAFEIANLLNQEHLKN